jgi:hypothetical protein
MSCGVRACAPGGRGEPPAGKANELAEPGTLEGDTSDIDTSGKKRGGTVRMGQTADRHEKRARRGGD